MENLGAISLLRAGDDHLLTRKNEDGSTSQIRLSDDDVLVLAQSAQSLRASIAAKSSREGAEAVVLSKVSDVDLSSDHHETEAYLTMIGEDGARTGYCLNLGVAQKLAYNLPKLVAQIERAAKNRPRQ